MEVTIPSLAYLTSVIFSFTAPLAGRLSDFYSVRGMVVFGGLLASSGMLATAFARQLWVAVVTYGLITGRVKLGPIHCTDNHSEEN